MDGPADEETDDDGNSTLFPCLEKARTSGTANSVVRNIHHVTQNQYSLHVTSSDGVVTTETEQGGLEEMLPQIVHVALHMHGFITLAARFHELESKISEC